jgi:hypothetical protein
MINWSARRAAAVTRTWRIKTKPVNPPPTVSVMIVRRSHVLMSAS